MLATKKGVNEGGWLGWPRRAIRQTTSWTPKLPAGQVLGAEHLLGDSINSRLIFENRFSAQSSSGD